MVRVLKDSFKNSFPIDRKMTESVLRSLSFFLTSTDLIKDTLLHDNLQQLIQFVFNINKPIFIFVFIKTIPS